MTLPSLDEALDPAVAGAKAAQLVRARAAGLPVLPGRVLSADASAPAVRVGAEAFRASGRAAAVLAIADLELDEALRRQLADAAGAVPGPVVVRSSVPLDVDPRWSGAFATYHEVSAEDLPAAVRGCWASAFSRDVLTRCEHLGVPAEELRVAVLIQPWVAFDGGGTAFLEVDGRARVTAVAGDPATLLGGRRAGGLAEVGPDGAIDGDAALDGLGPEVLAAVVDLLREAAAATGATAIEWGVAAGEVWLLQVRAGTPGSVGSGDRGAPPARARAAGPASDGALRVARLADRYPAPLGDALVLPWALGLAGVPEPQPIAVEDPHAALGEARATAGALTGEAWGAPPEVAEREAAAAIRAILAAEPEAALARLASLRPIDVAAATRLLGLVAGVGEHLAAGARLAHPELVWRCSLEELERSLKPDGRAPPARLGADRWEPFVAGVVGASGRQVEGTPAAPGIGAGRSVRIDGKAGASDPEPRRVLVLRAPMPQVAPLLWSCSGLVVRTGSVGAHLFEVARSLGVPAVVGADPGEASGALLAVDGDRGIVSVAPAAGAASGAGGAGA